MQECKIITVNGHLNRDMPFNIVKLKKKFDNPLTMKIMHSDYNFFECMNKFNICVNADNNDNDIYIDYFIYPFSMIINHSFNTSLL